MRELAKLAGLEDYLNDTRKVVKTRTFYGRKQTIYYYDDGSKEVIKWEKRKH